jgi:GAF domain-containing protein
MAGLAVERKEPVTTCNIQTDTSGDVRSGAKKTGLQGSLVVPILKGGAAVGALGIANREERTFTEAETELLLQAGRVVATLG